MALIQDSQIERRRDRETAWRCLSPSLCLSISSIPLLSFPLEFRPPDATCNIYLALAVQLMAGLDGVQRWLDPRELGYGPIDRNIFACNDEQRKAVKPLPSSLFESLHTLKNDHEFLQQGNVFDEGQIMEWIKVKTDEYYSVRNRPHPIEIAMYFDA